jgi:hypothetical protein
VVYVYPIEACPNRIYPIKCVLPTLNSCVAMSKDMLQGQNVPKIYDFLYTKTRHM